MDDAGRLNSLAIPPTTRKPYCKQQSCYMTVIRSASSVRNQGQFASRLINKQSMQSMTVFNTPLSPENSYYSYQFTPCRGLVSDRRSMTQCCTRLSFQASLSVHQSIDQLTIDSGRADPVQKKMRFGDLAVVLNWLLCFLRVGSGICPLVFLLFSF